MNRKVYDFWVCVNEPGVSVSIWATDCDIIRHKDSVYFWLNDILVAFFEFHDVLEICKTWEKEDQEFYSLVYSRKAEESKC